MGLVGEFVDLVIIVSLLEGLVGIPGFRNQEDLESQARSGTLETAHQSDTAALTTWR